jgi:hypothetical protein
LAGSLVDRTDWLVLVSFFVPHNELSNTLAAIFSTSRLRHRLPLLLVGCRSVELSDYLLGPSARATRPPDPFVQPQMVSLFPEDRCEAAENHA